MQKRALISVFRKDGIEEFARRLVEKGFEIISSGGTWKRLDEAGLNPIKVSDVTQFPEILDGRVKTLHPRIHGALLARYELESHRETLASQQIDPIHLVVVNLYPFSDAVAGGADVPAAVEMIDIGGPTMVRASAKNFKHLTVLTDPADYEAYLEEVDDQGLPSMAFRLNMAQKAFQHTFSYDMKIADWLDRVNAEGNDLSHQNDGALPTTFRMCAHREQELRYGENPHQRANFYRVDGQDLSDYVTQHQGKLMSYNNLVDMEAAWRCVCDFKDRPAAVIVKHTNPCGVAAADRLEDAFRRARKVDPVSSFGGVLAFNREVDEATAIAINEAFAELVIAPAFSEAALKKFKRKKNLRVLQITLPEGGFDETLDFKRLDHGLLVMDKDSKRVPFEDWKLVSDHQPSNEQIEALKMAWRIVAHVKSNAIVYADQDGALGIGAGQMSRVDSAKIAISKAGEAELSIQGSAMASDAFFPFRDSIDAAAAAGVKAIVEPGGSIRDDEVIAAANEHGIALFFTSTRHFKH